MHVEGGDDLGATVARLAADLLDATGFVDDGRGVVRVGVGLTLPAPRGVTGQLLLPGLG